MCYVSTKVSENGIRHDQIKLRICVRRWRHGLYPVERATLQELVGPAHSPWINVTPSDCRPILDGQEIHRYTSTSTTPVQSAPEPRQVGVAGQAFEKFSEGLQAGYL